MEKPLVSIVTPAYNSEKYIGEAIESARKQTYKNWEMIVVDDGSIDGTAEAVKKYAAEDPRIRYVYQENQKMASARNNGIANSRGKYIAFLDADNVFLPDKLETQVAYMEHNPSCGLSYARIRHFYHDTPDVVCENPQPMPSGNIFEKVLHQNFINVLAVLVRKDLFDLYGAFQPGWWACDEHYVWINLSYHGVRFCPLDQVVGLERLHRGSDSRRADYLIRTAERYQDMLDIVESWFSEEEKKKYGPDIAALRRKWRVRRVLAKFMVTPPFSFVLVPLFLKRRDNLYKPIRRL